MRGSVLAMAAVAIFVAMPGCAVPAADPNVMARTPKVLPLGAGPTRVALQPAKGARTLAAHLSAPRGRRAYVVIRGLRASQPPGVLYHVYLDLPAGAKPAQEDPRHIGIINFYNATPNTAPDRISHSFDITDAARALRAHGLLAARTSVTLIPAGDPAPGANATIARIELVEQ